MSRMESNYWKGTEDEYNKLYDYAVAGVRQAIPGARVGGPATTGPGPKGNASQFLQAFLHHCGDPEERGDRRVNPAEFHLISCQGKPQRDRRPRADGPQPRAEQQRTTDSLLCTGFRNSGSSLLS